MMQMGRTIMSSERPNRDEGTRRLSIRGRNSFGQSLSQLRLVALGVIGS
jgi:hypothetical protein